MKATPFALALWLGLLTLAPAQAAEAQDEAYDLATIEADHALCDFPLTDEQRDVIAQRRDALVSKGGLSEADLAAVQDQVSTALARQKAEGLCKPGGPEAQSYKRRLTGLGLL